MSLALRDEVQRILAWTEDRAKRYEREAEVYRAEGNAGETHSAESRAVAYALVRARLRRALRECPSCPGPHEYAPQEPSKGAA